jgi:hypothetical protein
MHEYASQKKHPTFEYLGDLIRCRATFDSLKQLELAYKKIGQEYQIVKMKNKLHTNLKNITFNFIYRGIIAEVQLIHGSIASELENHQLYEVVRCRSIQELYDVVEKWGGYNHLTDKDYVKGKVVDNRPMESTKAEVERMVSIQMPDAPPGNELRLIRSEEFGNTNMISEEWEDTNEMGYYQTEEMEITA